MRPAMCALVEKREKRHQDAPNLGEKLGRKMAKACLYNQIGTSIVFSSRQCEIYLGLDVQTVYNHPLGSIRNASKWVCYLVNSTLLLMFRVFIRVQRIMSCLCGQDSEIGKNMFVELFGGSWCVIINTANRIYMNILTVTAWTTNIDMRDWWRLVTYPFR